mmetsp:Transcript_6010/g.14331  ORF Transcript_6010/g.14331 Transcript_6010/m.14331 type:complete len:288 (-) Transcript_6010:163-1026(-)|eukprot:CAMPEP_0171091364 /NCGR_PEP_ID=MMETSP0766_2-20121228/32868_1 /TAXON_ID=439317 /ORGANISM="Gambierdiscus australes, Strain CAWD 149" /LENGTH=287 /DNA_ID=CAMNT_0011549463 /DNA_START=115 /DNA_END=981 /DNA_ORIENTATION=+
MYYTGKEFQDLKKKGPANGVGMAFAVAVLAFLIYQGAQLKPFLTLTDKAPWVWDLTVMGFMLKVAQDTREQVSGFFWPKALTVTAIAAFGGGFLAPLVVAHCPVPLREETFVWFLVFSWYVTHHVPFLSAKWCEIATSKPGWLVLTICFGVFKTQQIFGSIELAAKAIDHEPLMPHSRYFFVPCAGPLLCGFLGGCGGAFLPFDKGLRPIEEGKQWPVSMAFFSTVIYYFSTRWLRVPQLDAKLLICVLRIAGDLFPSTRSKIVEAITSSLYAGTNVRSARAEDAKV